MWTGMWQKHKSQLVWKFTKQYAWAVRKFTTRTLLLVAYLSAMLDNKSTSYTCCCTVTLRNYLKNSRNAKLATNYIFLHLHKNFELGNWRVSVIDTKEMLSIESMCRSCELDVVQVLTAWVIRPVIADDHTGLSKRLDSTCRVLRLPAASLRISCGPSLHVDRVSSIRVSAGLVCLSIRYYRRPSLHAATRHRLPIGCPLEPILYL